MLASQFGSFLQPVAIMVSLPLSMIGVIAALLITGSTLNIFSVIGIVMLMGLVTKNAILLVDFTNHAQKEGRAQMAAIMEAGQVRLRPILMTTLAMIFWHAADGDWAGRRWRTAGADGAGGDWGGYYFDFADTGGGAGGVHLPG